MDLDKIKEVWKETPTLVNITEDNICKVLDRKGKTSLSRLLLYERIALFLLPLLIVVPFIHDHFVPLFKYPAYLKTVFISACVISIFWQLYKLNLLKKINPDKTSILLSSKYIAYYKKCINYEIIAGLVFLLVFILLLSFSLSGFFTKGIKGIIFLTAMIVISVFLTILLYIYLYKKNIKNIESSIKEIEDFEKDNLE